MKVDKQYKVALVLYTQGLDYDDRVRKEILSIQKLYKNVRFTIFAITPNSNKEEVGVTSYGVPYKQVYLKSRDKYSSATHTFAKAFDFYKTIKKEVKQFDAVWCADMETQLCVLLLRGKPLVWDLHELPVVRKTSWIRKLLFKMAARRTKVMIHANEPRLNYLVDIGVIKSTQKQFILRNYPQFDEIDSEYDNKYHEFIKWLGDGECVYLQGLMDKTRADVESIEAVLSFPNLKAVVIGKIPDDRLAVIEEKVGKQTLYERCFFTGQIKQLKTPQYIRKCSMSLIFYKKVRTNNWYCEPNRLFQNLINGNPVVTGNNPPMKELVEKYGVGVCADTDGSEVKKIVEAIEELRNHRGEIDTRVEACKDNWLWNSQENVIGGIVENWLK